MSGTSPPTRNSSIRSWNWPWMSPHICHHQLSAKPSTSPIHKMPYRDRRVYAHHITLLYEQFPCLVADLAHLRLGYRTACSKLFNMPGICQDKSHLECRVSTYLSKSLIFPTAPCGAAVCFFDRLSFLRDPLYASRAERSAFKRFRDSKCAQGCGGGQTSFWSGVLRWGVGGNVCVG